MFSTNLNKPLRDFEKEIRKKEIALAQRFDAKHVIVSKPVSKPSSKKSVRHAVKEGKAGFSETGSRKCASGNQNVAGKQRGGGSAVGGVTVPLKSQDNGDSIIHKEIIENTGAMVEIIVRANPKNHTSKRSRSRSRVRQELPGSSVLPAERREGYVEITDKVCPKHPMGKNTDKNHLPWCERLKTGSYDMPSNFMSARTVQVNSTQLNPCADKPQSSTVNEYYEPTADLNEPDAVTHVKFNEPVGGNARVVSSQRDGSSIVIDPSQKSKISLDYDNLHDAVNHGGASDNSQYSKEISTVLPVFDPVRILNFLVRELKGIASKNVDGGSMKRVVKDMEETLARLPDKFRCTECKRPATTQSPPSKLYEPERSPPDVATALLEARCSQLTSDKEMLEVELAAKNKTIQDFESKEKEYLQKIYNLTNELTEIKKKNNEQLEMLSNLSNVTFQLKNENKVIAPLREAQAKMSSRLEELTQSVEKQETELQVMRLERDKYRLLLEDKTKDMEGLKQLVRNIQFIVSEQLTNLKNVVQQKNAKDKLDSVIRAVSECSVKMNGEVLHEDRVASHPLCSSPTSSIVSSTLGISPSWQMISEIPNIPEEDDTSRLPPSGVLAHGSVSNLGEYHLDETLRFDDSKDLQESLECQPFYDLQSANELARSTTPTVHSELPRGSGAIDAAPPKTVQGSLASQGREVGSRTVGEGKLRLDQLCKVFQDLSENVLFFPNSSRPFRKQQSPSVENSSDWSDCSNNT